MSMIWRQVGERLGFLDNLICREMDKIKWAKGGPLTDYGQGYQDAMVRVAKCMGYSAKQLGIREDAYKDSIEGEN